MKIFLDTSSLFKLYHQEQGSESIEQIFTEHEVRVVFLSEITILEFSSAVWKKVRVKEINATQAQQLIEAFESDFPNYVFVQIDRSLVEGAQILLQKYGNAGLRTLDSIQLATAQLLKGQIGLASSSDKLLLELFKNEGLPC